MTRVPSSMAAPVVLQAQEGEALWFLGGLVTIKVDGATSGGQFALIEHLAPQGPGPPLHVHAREDEWFFVVEGELTFWVGGRLIAAPAGAFIYGPRGVPHTYVVTSREARFLVGVQPAGFENFVRMLAEPARSRTLPPPTLRMPEPERLTTVAAEYGIEVLGPPGIPS